MESRIHLTEKPYEILQGNITQIQATDALHSVILIG